MPLKTSWVSSANAPEHPFPLNNLPYGVFSTEGTEPRCGVAIGDMILDMQATEEAGLIALADVPLFDVPYWNDLMEEGPAAWAAMRNRLTEILADGSTHQSTAERQLVPRADARFPLPPAVSAADDVLRVRHPAITV